MRAWQMLTAAGLWLAPVLAWGQAELPGVTPSIEAAEEQAPAGVPPKVTIDVEALLSSPLPLSAAAEDAVWQLTGLGGGRIIQLPLVIEPGESATTITSGTIGVRGGRFITFHLLPEPSEAKVGAAGGGTDPAEFRGLPAQTPLFLRKFDVQPNGTMTWKLERFINGAALKDVDVDYAYRIDLPRLSKIDPGAPPRITRDGNEDMRTFNERRRSLEQEHRAKSAAFRDRRKAVMELPDEFTAPLPPRVWAVFEVGGKLDAVTVTGVAPEPWPLDIAGLELIRRWAGAADAGAQQMTPMEKERALAALQSAVDSGHPYNVRLAAYASARSGLPAMATPGDAAYRVLGKLIAGDDTTARLTTLKSVAGTVPPTQATVALLKESASTFDAPAQLAALSGLLRADPSDFEQMRSLVESTTKMLADPQGPDPAEVLATLVSQANPAAYPALEQTIAFATLPEDRKLRALHYVLVQAPHHPLPAGWLHFSYLNPRQPDMIRLTLATLNAATLDTPDAEADRAASAAADAPVDPTAAPAEAGPTDMLAKLRSLVGQPAAPTATPGQPARAAIEPPAPDFAPPVPSDAKPLTLVGRLKMPSPEHHLVMTFTSTDPAIREQAWKALPFLVIAEGPTATSPNAGSPPVADAARLAKVYDAILAAALAQTDTPGRVVPFFVRQSDTERVTAALVDLVLNADVAAAARAGQALLGSERAIEPRLVEMSVDERVKFAQRLYAAAGEDAPLTTGIMRLNNPQSPFLPWFANAVSKASSTGLPTASDWAKPPGNEDALLQIALSTDQVVALGAAAALAASVGGNDDHARELAKAFDLVTTRTVEGIRPEWLVQRKRIFTARLQGSAGPHRLTLRIYPAPDPALPPPAPDAPLGEPDKVVDLGTVDLAPEGETVVLAARNFGISTPPDKLAIRIDDLAQLHNMPGEEVKALPLDQVGGGVELEPQPDGSWRGVFTLPPRNARAEVVLVPVKG